MQSMLAYPCFVSLFKPFAARRKAVERKDAARDDREAKAISCCAKGREADDCIGIA